MTCVEGLPISNDLANFLKHFCHDPENKCDFLLFGIESISDVQDLVTQRMGEMNSDEKQDVANILSDLVSFKHDLKKLHSLLPLWEEVNNG